MQLKIPSWLIFLFSQVVLWIFFTGEISIPQIIWSLVVGAAILPLAWPLLDLHESVPLAKLLRRTFGFAYAFVTLFIPDALRSSIDVAKRIIVPVIPMAPGVVAVPLRLSGPAEALALNNHIVLTPGQFIVDIDEANGMIYIHALDARDPQKIRQGVHDLQRKASERIGW